MDLGIAQVELGGLQLGLRGQHLGLRLLRRGRLIQLLLADRAALDRLLHARERRLRLGKRGFGARDLGLGPATSRLERRLLDHEQQIALLDS